MGKWPVDIATELRVFNLLIHMYCSNCCVWLVKYKPIDMVDDTMRWRCMGPIACTIWQCTLETIYRGHLIKSADCQCDSVDLLQFTRQMYNLYFSIHSVMYGNNVTPFSMTMPATFMGNNSPVSLNHSTMLHV